MKIMPLLCEWYERVSPKGLIVASTSSERPYLEAERITCWVLFGLRWQWCALMLSVLAAVMRVRLSLVCVCCFSFVCMRTMITKYYLLVFVFTRRLCVWISIYGCSFVCIWMKRLINFYYACFANEFCVQLCHIRTFCRFVRACLNVTIFVLNSVISTYTA